MAVALVDTLSYFEAPTPGDDTLALSLPAHGDRDLIIVALTVADGVDIARRRPPLPSGYITDPEVFDVDGWATVVDSGNLRVLTHLGAAAGLDLPIVGDGGLIVGLALTFSGTSENGLAGQAVTGPQPATGTGQALDLGLLYDGLVVALLGTTAVISTATITDPGWTPALVNTGVAAEWAVITAGSSLGPTWEWSLNGSGADLTIATVQATEAFNDLAVLRSASYAPGALTTAPAPGDPPAVFTELSYPSDGVPPEPEPVLTPTEPWWQP